MNTESPILNTGIPILNLNLTPCLVKVMEASFTYNPINLNLSLFCIFLGKLNFRFFYSFLTFLKFLSFFLETQFYILSMTFSLSICQAPSKTTELMYLHQILTMGGYKLGILKFWSDIHELCPCQKFLFRANLRY